MEASSPPFRGVQAGHATQAEEKPVLAGPRRKREFIPEEKKDALYWDKRHKNNDAAKRSRKRRRMNDYAQETHLTAMKEENTRLGAELMAMKLHFSLAHPAAYNGYHGNQLQHHVHPATGAYHQSLQRDYFWGGRDSPVMARHQPPHPVFINAYGLHAMRGYSYLNTSGAGLLTPLLFPRNLPIYSSFPGAAPLRPIPTRAAFDEDEEEEEQQVLGVLSPSCPARHRNYTPREYMSNCMMDASIVQID